MAHDLDQFVVFQNGVAVTHPGFPQIRHFLGDEAVGKSALRAAAFKHGRRSAVARARRAALVG